VFTLASVGGAGCGGGGGGGGGGSTGTGGSMSVTLAPENIISDFEDLAAATVKQAGTPPRNGYWYTYNDDNPMGTSTCMQTPPAGPQIPTGQTAPTYVGTAPPSPSPGGSAALALHAVWSNCGVWGAGVGADLNQPMQDGGTYTGPKVPYDVTAFTGVTFFAMATAGTDTALRIKLPMTDETKIEDGGLCMESATTKCSDDYGYMFNLPSNGTWKQITVRFADRTSFKQEGWGKAFDWTPGHVTSVQIQSQHKTEPYDFWIDDMYFFTE
jgi:hypothetical protein